MVPATWMVATPADVAVKTALATPIDDLVISETMTDFELLAGVPQRQPERRTISNDPPTWVATVQGVSIDTTRTRSLAATPQVDEEVDTMMVVVVVVVDAVATGAAVTNSATIDATNSGERRRTPVECITSVSHRGREVRRRPSALYETIKNATSH
jgi:hypothetical protein